MEIEIEFITSEVLVPMSKEERLKYILDHIRKNKILVVEESLSSTEEVELIEATMKQIDEKFSGIEVSTLREKTEGGLREMLIRLLGGRTGGLTVIGSSKLI